MNRSDWSITDGALDAIIGIINDEKIYGILEFGSGYSTYRLATETDAVIIGFEHMPEHWMTITNALADAQRGSFIKHRVFNVPLCYNGNDNTPVLLADYDKTDLQDVFYEINHVHRAASLFRDYRCVVLDGPNGSGRSLAFRAIAAHLAFPCYILIDDVDDYDFVGAMKQVYEAELIEHRQEQNKAWAIYKLTGVKA